MSTYPDPYHRRGVPSPDPYDDALRPLPPRAQTPTAVGTKSLKRLKNAPPRRPEGRAASLQERDRLILDIVEWAQLAAEGIEGYRR